jgi:RecB family exonuclease
VALSFTQLSSYRRCPRQYEYCYVKKIPKGMSEAEAYGAAIHNTLRKWGALEMSQSSHGVAASGQRFGVSGQQALFVEEEAHRQPLPATRLLALWRDCFPLDAYATRVEADAARLRGEAALRAFHVWWKREERAVIAVEKGFSVTIPPSPSEEGGREVEITGRCDRIERTAEGLHVIDFKTSPPRSQADANADLQLSIYALAAQETYGELPAVLTFLHLDEDGVTEVSTTRSESQLRDAVKHITSFHERIAGKDFHPTPSVVVCRGCPYRGICDVAAV